ncbi:hypothetical protein, partial [Actinomadura bangladeshensis]
MTGPQGGGRGGRSRPPERPDGLPPWLRRFLQVMFLDLCSTVIVSIGVTLVHGAFWLNAAVTLLVVAVLTGALFAFYPRTAHAVLERVSRTLRWGGATLAWGLGGAAVMALVLLAGTGAVRLHERTGSCGQPLDLRVLTAPETLTPLRAAAAEFADDSEDRGCREYSVTVVPEAGPVPLYDGFRLLWRRSEAADAGHADDQQLFGPQPDIWIPSSTAEYDFVPKGPGQTTAATAGSGAPSGTGDPVFRVRGSVGTSPLVLALFTRAHESVADPIAAPIAPSTAALLERVADAGVRLRAIARPVPETSA